MAEPKSPLTSARMFDKQDNEHLAQWLDNDADAMDGQPGRNNHVAAVRAAAERLRSIPANPHLSEESLLRGEATGANLAEILENAKKVAATFFETSTDCVNVWLSEPARVAETEERSSGDGSIIVASVYFVAEFEAQAFHDSGAHGTAARCLSCDRWLR